METLQQQQPIIVQSGSNKKSVIDYVFIAGLIGGGLYLGNRWWVKHKAESSAEKLDNPAQQAASNIYNAKHWYGNTPDVAFDAARSIATNKIAWADVAKAFKDQYNDNINTFLDFLGADKKAQFFNIINLTQDKDTKFTGKPPAKSTLKYDVINNYCFAVAIKGANIRKSPEVIGNGGYTSMIGSSNIIAVAEINQALGMMTGQYKLSSDGKTAFVEFYGNIWDGNAMQLKGIWVAASNIKVVQFSKKTLATEAKAYMDGTKSLTIDASKYNSANS